MNPDHATCGRGCLNTRRVNIFVAMRVRTLIKALGGATEVATALGARIQTVSNWSARDNIPAEYHLPIWRLAIAKSVSWRPPNSEGFSPPAPADRSPGQEEAA
jgi:hypothetical protein